MSGGIGMSLLQKMGWKQGEGLGKDNKGSLEPLALSVKMDRKGGWVVLHTLLFFNVKRGLESLEKPLI